MRIGIDARMWGPKHGGAGIGRYVEEVIEHLQVVDHENQYVVFLRSDALATCPIPDNWTAVRADVPWYGLREQWVMPKLIRRSRVDVMHFPHFNVPWFCPVPYVLTLHDLIMLEQNWHSGASTLTRGRYALKHLLFRTLLHHVVKRARNIVTVSQYAQQQIIHRYPASAHKVHVVYNGIDRVLTRARNINTKRSAGVLPDGIGSPFILNVGNAYPHKNLETLLHAFSFFVKEHPNTHLVLAGPDSVFVDRLKKEAREIAIPDDRIHFLGYVSEDVLDQLYHQASVYVIPSKMEGFGLPPLEALAHGTPVAASRSSSIPEILGQAALYFNPEDIEELFRAMERLMKDKTTRANLQAQAPAVLARYSWDTHARALLDLYRLAFLP